MILKYSHWICLLAGAIPSLGMANSVLAPARRAHRGLQNEQYYHESEGMHIYPGVVAPPPLESNGEGDYGLPMVDNPDVVYQTTISAKGSKKQPYHADYEYIPGVGSEYDYTYEEGKGGKKAGILDPGHPQYASKKGGKGSKKGSGCSSKGGKGKGGKGGKKGDSSSDDECEDFPTPAPSFTAPPFPTPSSADVPTSRPPSPIVEPTLPPVPTRSPAEGPVAITPSPTHHDSIAIPLDDFVLLYEVDSPRQPMREETRQLEDVTRLYLEEFMMAEFPPSPFTVLDDFITVLETTTYIPGAPIVADYEAVARFNSFTTVFPSEEQLNEAVEIAFLGANMDVYMARLEGLEEGNLFRGATAYYGSVPTRVSKKSSAATIAAAAVAATLLAAGLVLYKRQSQEEVEDHDVNKAYGDITVAGETFAGDTYDGTASVGGASLEQLKRYRDEEEGVVMNNLGTIQEQATDSASVTPAWGNAADKGEDADHEGEKDGGESIIDNLTMPEVSEEDVREQVERNDTFVEGATEDGISTTERDSTSSTGISEAQSFDEVALQQPSHVDSTDSSESFEVNEEASQTSSESNASHFMEHKAPPVQGSKNDIASLLSYDSFDEKSSAIHRSMSSKDDDSSTGSRQPRTVAEIEAMLSADIGEDPGSIISAHLSSGDDSYSAEESTVTSQRPRTVEEIEQLLSAGLDNPTTL